VSGALKSGEKLVLSPPARLSSGERVAPASK